MQTRLIGATLIALLLGATATAQSPDLPGDIEVMLAPADQSRLRISTVRLEVTQAPDIVEAYARVLDITALASLDAEIETAAAAAEVSASAAKRLELLAADNEIASLQSLEGARSQSQSDAARLQLARRRVALEWGAELAARGDAFRRQLIDRVAAGDAALLRVDPQQSGSVAAGSVRLKIGSGTPAMATEALGIAAVADPRTQTMGMLVLLRNNDTANLRPGLVVAAEIDTGRQLSGVVLPRDSLIRIDGGTWVHLQRGGDRFIRREVRERRLLEQGWFVSSSFAAGDNVVTTGSGSLFAVERADETTEAD